jgi:hypothetical protein
MRSPGRVWLITFAISMSVLALGIALAVLFDGGNPLHGPATPPATSTTPAADLGVRLYQSLHDAGATMPASWSATADANRALICELYSHGYAGAPPSETGPYHETVAMIMQSISETGFCS